MEGTLVAWDILSTWTNGRNSEHLDSCHILLQLIFASPPRNERPGDNSVAAAAEGNYGPCLLPYLPYYAAGGCGDVDLGMRRNSVACLCVRLPPDGGAPDDDRTSFASSRGLLLLRVLAAVVLCPNCRKCLPRRLPGPHAG